MTNNNIREEQLSSLARQVEATRNARAALQAEWNAMQEWFIQMDKIIYGVDTTKEQQS